MRTLEPPNRGRIGLMGIIVVVLVVGVGLNITNLPLLSARPSYYGQFTDTGQLSVGDQVRITGVEAGHVQGIEIDGDRIVMKFSIGTNTIGTDSRLAIRTDTILGKKILEVEPLGAEQLRPGGTLPLSQSTTPYQIYDAFFDATKAAAGWNIETVKQSLNVLSQTIDQTAPHLSATLDGVARFADTIGKRDDQITHLLAQANQVARVLGDRSKQIDTLLVDSKTLLAAFNQRGRAMDALLGRIAAFSTQLQGLIDDNPNLNNVLEQLRSVSDLLRERKDDVAQSFSNVANFAAGLNEAVASGPYFKVQLANLIPYQVLQPWVDAAFKKRGIEPEEFWRNAGLPAFRYPDPNGTRFANGAPPPAPPVLEGTPEHPGPAVVPGTPCSYAPAVGMFPTPANPLPCAGLDQDAGPFGAHGGLGPYPGSLPEVLTSPPNPDGLVSSPGIAVGGRPGEVPPSVPGTPVPLPPQVPPGARAEPPGPVSGPEPANPSSPNWGTPGDKTLPAPTGPLGTGPGDGLPVPFIPPGQGGNSQPGGGGGSLGR
ncbi:MAG TPA: MCE family protein [Mycobacterium sp.]|nr:MCE family protein [Mycobacterium sp.]